MFRETATPIVALGRARCRFRASGPSRFGTEGRIFPSDVLQPERSPAQDLLLPMTSSPPPDDTPQLLRRFTDTFLRAIDAEMRAMRDRLGPFEIQLANGRREGDPDQEDAGLYAFDLLSTDEKLVPQLECTLRGDAGEQLVTVIAVDAREVVIQTSKEIRMDRNYSLVIYPWFLYERLKEALDGLPESTRHRPKGALRLFGKLPATRVPCELLADHEELNGSQTAAVRLSAESDVAFVWGPPGTGKTHTLGHIVAELVRRGERVLITSTTNAAVDQALRKLMEIEETRALIERGLVIRIGQQPAEQMGVDLREAVRRQNEELGAKVTRLRERITQLREELARAAKLMELYAAAATPMQFDMFREVRQKLPGAVELAAIFGAERGAHVARLPAEEQAPIVQRHIERLGRAAKLAAARGGVLTKELRGREGSAIERASVILATMTNLYLSPQLKGDLFDAVIIEEAGMAVLPTLFYAASLAHKRVIAVGDPRQLPPIVQSNEEYARRAMGRNIFDVAAPDPLTSELVALLDTQYRMHPRIGGLVSELYYQGRLANGREADVRNDIAARAPFPGEPLVLVDVAGATAVAGRSGGRSRSNETTAGLAVELAVEGVRSGLSSVAIITPYVDQARLIREMLGRFRLEASQIECRTVHRFQGSERDMVILDTVDAPPLNPGTLLAGEGSGARNLLNVGISRARGKLIVLADVAYFTRRAPRAPITELLERATSTGAHLATP